jgi:N-dimethylarginine dimethylaminohydrolase
LDHQVNLFHYKGENMTPIAVEGGAGWRQRTAAFTEEMPKLWGGWGVSTEYGRLRAVLLRRPGPEIDAVTDPNAALWLEAMEDTNLTRAQHDALAEVYRAHGAAVHYVEHAWPDKPNAHFVRDLMLMTPEGAIVTRPASQQRAGEERFVAEALGRLGVPVLMTVHGEGTFEGADVVLARAGLAILAEGMRTNVAGVEQVEWALRQVGYHEIVRVQLPYGTVHLDGVLSTVDRDLALVRFRETPLPAVEALRDHCFRILEVPPEDRHMPENIVALAPGHLVMPAGNPRTKSLLEEAGCTIVEVEMRELQKSGGAMHCLTGFLKRDDP